MAEFYQMPAVSPTMELGTLVSWRVAEGESFESGTILAEIGTDKANMDAEIFDDGVLLKHLVEEGAEVPPGKPIAIWGASADEDISDLVAEYESGAADAPAPEAADAKEESDASAEKDTSESESESAPKAKDEKASAKPPASAPKRNAVVGDIQRQWMGKNLPTSFLDTPGDIQAAPAARPKASPLARKLAESKGVALGSLTGTGTSGRIVAADVDNAPVGGSGPAARPDTVVRNSPMRKTIAKRLLESHQDIPVFFLTATFDMQGFVDMRTQLKAKLPDVKVSYNDILVAAVAKSLRQHPFANAQWGADEITQRGAVDIGIAVALPAGLITPVLRDADQMSLSEIGSTVRDLASRAKAGKLAPDEYQGASFTISNLGMMEIEQFTAIINPPEVAILAVGAIEQVPVVADGELTLGWRMKVTMSCDHRVLDGAVGAAFLQTLRTYVETPTLLLV